MLSLGLLTSGTGRFVLLALTFSLLLATVGLAAGRARVQMEGDAVVFETDHLKYTVGTDGINRGFADRITGKNHLDVERPGNFMCIQREGRSIGATAVELAGPFLYVRFADPGVWAKIHVRVLPHYLTLQVIAVNAPGTEQVDLVRIPLTLSERVSRSLTSARNDAYAAAVIPLNLETTSYAQGSAELIGHADRTVGLEGAKVAVIGAPIEKFLDIIEEVELENGLPHATLGGVWARRSAEQMKSYLFVDLSASTADAMIDYALAGGFGYIVVYDGVWNASHGTYPVNRQNFPEGETGLKAVSDKIHAAGLKFGMHNLDMVVDKSSDLVRPVPDRGFMMYPDRRRVLAADIGPDDTFIPTTESPTGLLAKADKSRFHGRDLRLDDEIIVYDDLQTVAPYGFTGCNRGAHGTVRAGHSAGATIDNFSEFIGYYRPNVKTDLYDRIARAEAEALDKFEFDYIYPDGIGENLGYWPEGPQWYISNLLVSKLFHYTRRELLFGHSPISAFSWHVFSRGNTTDFVHKGMIEHFDRVSVAGANDCDTELQPFEFGWFGYFTHALDCDATRPREMEYAWSKALAYGAAMSLETTKAALDGNGRTREIFAIIKNWEILKLAGHFPATLREQLRVPGKEFTLKRRENRDWDVVPVFYGPNRYVAASAGKQEEQDVWDFDNPHDDQPLRVTIEARPDLAPYGHADNVVLLEPGPLCLYSEGAGPLGQPMRQSPGLDFALDVTPKLSTPEGQKCFAVSAQNHSATPAGWGCAEVVLADARNLTQHRALGTWVEGDGSGAYLHFIIEDTGRWSVRDYYVKLDFTGWRYIKIHSSAAGEIYDFNFPYSNYWAIRNINFAAIGRVYVFLSGLPPSATATARFGRLEALKETPHPVQNPSLTVNGERVAFPVTIEPEGYLEFQAEGTARVFDPNGVTKADVPPGGKVPVLKKGRNEIRFLCDCDPCPGAGVQITMHTLGEPLQ